MKRNTPLVSTHNKADRLVSSSLMGLIARNVNVTGIKCQVRNPKYIDSETPAMWRTLAAIETYKERGQMWVVLRWERETGDSCNFTGCTQSSDSCVVEFTRPEFTKMLRQSNTSK